MLSYIKNYKTIVFKIYNVRGMKAVSVLPHGNYIIVLQVEITNIIWRMLSLDAFLFQSKRKQRYSNIATYKLQVEGNDSEISCFTKHFRINFDDKFVGTFLFKIGRGKNKTDFKCLLRSQVLFLQSVLFQTVHCCTTKTSGLIR